jgi:hypothetical protein
MMKQKGVLEVSNEAIISARADLSSRTIVAVIRSAQLHLQNF